MPVVSVSVHGAGSTAEFCARVFRDDDLGCARGIQLAHLGDVEMIIDDLAAIVSTVQKSGDEVLLCGVSLGAHAIARFAATSDSTAIVGLLCVMPAWTGEPGDVASMTIASAERIRRDGARATLLGLDPGDWVAGELLEAWAAYDDAVLAAALVRAGHSRGPTPDELAAIDIPVGLVALAEDPLHPLAVAQDWQAMTERSALEIIGRDDPRGGVDILGRRAAEAWRRASGSR